ncbi:hypothetical protein [uncultured Streptococcus sp.]|uniref:hypothetical protein n=1 Tax=uncultured Streptococcus sp. TaxID=83427 RepID=UPI0028D1BAC4|nr:hypothetical protein [uncultured Streptococcus sp.]
MHESFGMASYSLSKEKLLIVPLVKLFGNQSSDRRKGVETKGLESSRVGVTLDQDDNSKQSLETYREPVNGVLTHEANESSIYSYFFALPKWLALAYYGLGIIGLILTGPLPFILFYATSVHLILFTIGFLLTQLALAVDSQTLWVSASIFYGLSAIYGLLWPLQILSLCLTIDVLLSACFWRKRPVATSGR